MECLYQTGGGAAERKGSVRDTQVQMECGVHLSRRVGAGLGMYIYMSAGLFYKGAWAEECAFVLFLGGSMMVSIGGVPSLLYPHFTCTLMLDHG